MALTASSFSGPDQEEGWTSPLFDEVRPALQRLVVRCRLDEPFKSEARVNQPIEQRRQHAVVLLDAFGEPALLAQPLLGVVIQGPVQPPTSAVERPAVRRVA